MQERTMLKEPVFDYPLTDGKRYVCLDRGQYHAYLDRDAAVILLHSLHWLYDQPPGEEVSIWAEEFWENVPRRGQPIGYCEFNLVPAHLQKKQGKNIRKVAQPTVRKEPHGIYSPENDRLDYFVSPEEVKTAYEALTLALENSEGKRSPSEVTLFDTLVLHLLPS
jgi:hypothetical protein